MMLRRKRRKLTTKNRRSMNERIGPAADCDGEKEEKGGDHREDDRDDHGADPSSPQTDQLGPHLAMILMIFVLILIILTIISTTLIILVMIFVVIISKSSVKFSK